MRDWSEQRNWDEMIEVSIRDGQALLEKGRQAAANDRFHTAFEVLVRSYHYAIVAFCRNMLGGQVSEIEDIAQEVFLAAWRTLSRFRHEAQIRTWIFAIARNQCRDALRRRRADAVSGEEAQARLEDLPDATPLLPERYEHQDFVAWVKRGLAQLRGEDREVLVMTYITELPPVEIATVLGIEVASVRTRRKRALQRLREVIRDVSA